MNKIFSKILSTITAGAVTIFVSSGSLQTVVNEIRANAAEIVYGDADNSGSVDSFDLTLIRKEAVTTGSTKCNTIAADVNGDGIIDNSDVREVQQYLLGKRNSFSVIERNLVPVPKTTIVSKDQPIETSMTQEMAQKADELKDAVSIYNYVYNNINSEFYYGSRKGAIGTFEQGCGNDMDIASLLIAMLRYKGYTANYVLSLAVFTDEQLLKWTRTENTEAAEKIYSTQNRIHDIKYDINGNKYYTCEYNYVQLEDKGKIYYLDACFKEYEKQDTIYDKFDSSYNFTDANTIIQNNNLNLFESDIDKAISNVSNIEEKHLSINSYKIIHKNFNQLEEEDPHQFADLDSLIFESIPQEYHDLMTIAFSDECAVSFYSVELYKKNITVEYRVSDDTKSLTALKNDDDIGWLFGGSDDVFDFDSSSIFTLPSVVQNQYISVTPVVKVDGKTVLTGPNLDIGDKQTLYISTRTEGEIKTYTEELTAGEMCSIIVDTGSISSNELAEAYNKTLGNTSEINKSNNLKSDILNDKLNEDNVYSYEYLGNILYLTGVMYFSQLDISTYSLAEGNNINCENTLRFGVISFKPGVYSGTKLYEDQKDGIQKDGKIIVNILSNTVNPVSKNNNTAKLQTFILTRGIISSELESSVLEQIFNVESLSTTTIFRYAQKNNIPLVTLSPDSNEKVSDLNINSEDAQRIQEEIKKGNTIIIPQSNITLDSNLTSETWSGTGYIEVSADGTSQEYYISGGYKGGSTLAPIGLYYSINVALDLAFIAESISMIISALVAMETFFPIIGIAICAVLVIALTFDIIEQSLLYYDYAVEGDEEAGLKIWASTASNSITTLVTFGIGKGVSTVAGHITESRLLNKYGTTTIENLKSSGFSTSKINSQVKHFQKLGLTQPTIDTMLKNPRCMDLGKDVLEVIGQTGGSQRMLAEFVLRNGDDVAKSVVNLASKEGTIGIVNLFDEFGKSSQKLAAYGITDSNIINKLQTDYILAKTSSRIITEPVSTSPTVLRGVAGIPDPNDPRPIERQNEAAQLFADKGYDIEMLPDSPSGNGYGLLNDSCPDYLINGQPFDCYSPDKNTSVRNIWTTVKGKTETQARRIVINFNDSNKTLTELINQFHTWERDLPTLDELLVVKDGEIIRAILK